MCGICGFFDLEGKPADPIVLDAMMRRIAHRGPDGSGDWIEGEVALGHRRLSIIDLAGGSQPVGNEDGSVQVVFNGEIYNFVELTRNLESLGHRFQTRSDTEVIVHAYEEWGTECVKQFNGMFAFALWDRRNRRLFLARDHLGIKPLYYTQVGSTVVFASEIKALLEFPGCTASMDVGALSELFTFRYVPSPKTLFQGICKLPPAHWMLIGNGRIQMERFWNFVPRERPIQREEELIEEYQALTEDAVRLQMRADVPVGLFLSSGVDSGALLAIMSTHASGPVQAFTIAFEDGSENEEADARELALRFGAEHHVQTLSPEDYENYFERYLADIEEPVGNETAAAFYFVAKMTSQKVKVALTGQGADEPWAGYDRYKGIKLSEFYSRIPSFITGPLAQVAQQLPGRLERFKRGVASLGERDMLTRLAKVYSFFGAEMKDQLFRGMLRDNFEQDPFGTRHALGRLQNDVSHLSPLEQMLYIDTRASLPDDLLMVGDKTSMACSLEARVPFLDYRIVEFIESLPSTLRLKGLTGKYLHKRACEKWLPQEVVYRKKKGFANPVEEWFRRRMRPFVEDCLLSPDSSMGVYFDQRYIRKILDADRNGSQQYRRHIFLLVSLELWHRAFMSNVPARA